jgi:DNA-binding CsgD family transcriptional regulator
MATLAFESRLRGRAGLRTAVAAVLAILTLIGLELVTPPVLPLGAAVLVLVVFSALFLDERWVVAIVALAVAGRAIDAGLGDISPGLAALESGSFIAVAGAGLASRRDFHPVPAVAAAVATPAIAPAAPVPARGFEGAGLTEREREVIVMAMQGLTAAQVAERLFISKRTVETHLERAYAKLGVRSKRELIASAFDQARAAAR